MKIRGQRIEPGEIEAFLSKQPFVDQAVVLPHTDPATGSHLVAYIVPKPHHNGYLAKVKAAAQQTLPRAMVPAAYVEVDEFPITPNGKLDTKALPAPVFTTAADFSAPQTPLEIAIAEVYADVLGVSPIGLDDDFFTLGGTSLLTLTLREELSERAGFQVSTRAIFEAPSVRALARHHSVRRAGTVPPEVLETDAVLPDDITVGDLPRPRKVRNVLLTGATGFLGTQLLAELLQRHGVVIWCIVRAQHDAQATTRVHDALKTRGLWHDRFEPRIVAIAGDLGKPAFGLPESDYAHLSQEIDLVIHNGARVNHVEPYETLRPVNVSGTVEMLRFATTSTLKPVHFVSTASTVMAAEGTEIPESAVVPAARGSAVWLCREQVGWREAHPRGCRARHSDGDLPPITHRGRRRDRSEQPLGRVLDDGSGGRRTRRGSGHRRGPGVDVARRLRGSRDRRTDASRAFSPSWYLLSPGQPGSGAGFRDSRRTAPPRLHSVVVRRRDLA